MQPLINPIEKKKKDRVFIVRPFDFRTFFGRPRIEEIVNRGDVISIVSPKNPRECFLKRIIGMPGDIVKTINYKKEYVCVPEGHCWIEGDNYKSSYDSNAFGCVPMGLVIGQAKYIVFPLKRAKKIESELPIHRKLKLIKNKSSEEENAHTYLIDFRPGKSSDDLGRYDTNDDYDDFLDENGDDNEDEDEDEK